MARCKGIETIYVTGLSGNLNASSLHKTAIIMSLAQVLGLVLARVNARPPTNLMSSSAVLHHVRN